MARRESGNRVLLDLNNKGFQENRLGLDEAECNRVTETLRKLRQQTWDQMYRGPGLKWETIASIKPRVQMKQGDTIEVSAAGVVKSCNVCIYAVAPMTMLPAKASRPP